MFIRNTPGARILDELVRDDYGLLNSQKGMLYFTGQR